MIARTGIRSLALFTKAFVDASFSSQADSAGLQSSTAPGPLPHQEELASSGRVPTRIAELTDSVEGCRQRCRNALDSDPLALALESIRPIPAPWQPVWGDGTDPERQPLWQQAIRIEAGERGR